MMVWFPTAESNARPALPPDVTTNAKISNDARRSANAIKEEDEPTSSGNGSHFDWWTANLSARTGWVEYAFEKPSTVSESQLYWFDDTGHGGCKVPASWRLLYKDGDEWKPVKTASPYAVEKDKYNQVTFKPVTTTGLRVEVTMQPNVSTGIERWRVK
jgi:hypothetical protein